MGRWTKEKSDRVRRGREEFHARYVERHKPTQEDLRFQFNLDHVEALRMNDLFNFSKENSLEDVAEWVLKNVKS